jgi:thiamine-monophosphate kinase
MKEREVINRLREAFPDSGIGDDTAVLPGASLLHGGNARLHGGTKRTGGEADLLFASDAIVEGVHFRRETSTLSQAIQKLVTSNVSDVYAMGGKPAAIVFTAALSSGTSPEDLDQIVDGLKRACSQYKVKLAGGDTVWNPTGLVFDVAIVGTVAKGRAIPRSGAQVGDRIVLFGEIGPSLAGLSVVSAACGGRMEKGVLPPPPALRSVLAAAPRIKDVLHELTLSTTSKALTELGARFKTLPHAADVMRFGKRHLVPLAAPLDASILDHPQPLITSMIDISDGLAKDLRTICAESGVGALVREESIPVPASIGKIFGLTGSELIDFAISSGEEYVLLATARGRAARAAFPGGTVIGSIMPANEGIILIDEKDKWRTLPELGYEHSF